MARRLFFVDQIRSGVAEIHGEDAEHLVRVLRAEPGQRYEISNNERLYCGEIEIVRKSLVTFRVVEELERTTNPVRITLLAAITKFDHFEWALEKATEIGVEKIVPVVSERTEKGLDRAAVKRMDRWRRILKESSQQCRRWHRPELEDPVHLTHPLPATGLRLLLDEQKNAPPILDALPTERLPGADVAIMVGPEGGWTEKERELLCQSGWVAVSLGPYILRAETAAVAGLAILSAAWRSCAAEQFRVSVASLAPNGLK